MCLPATHTIPIDYGHTHPKQIASFIQIERQKGGRGGGGGGKTVNGMRWKVHKQ